MSKVLGFEKADFDGGQLAEELRQIPGLAPVDNRARFSLTRWHAGLTLEVPDGTDEEAVRAAVEAHAPRAAAPAPPDAGTLIAALATMDLDGATTVAQLKAAISPVRAVALAVVAAGAAAAPAADAPASDLPQ